MSVVQLSSNRKALFAFLLVVAAAEFVYCFSALLALGYIVNSAEIIFYSKCITIVLLIALGIWCLLDLKKNKHDFETGIVKRGYFSAIVHPQQITFWLLWGTLLFQNQMLKHQISHILLFAILNSFGTISILLLYAYVGRKLTHLFERNKRMLNKLAGLFSIGLSLFQLADILIS